MISSSSSSFCCDGKKGRAVEATVRVKKRPGEVRKSLPSPPGAPVIEPKKEEAVPYSRGPHSAPSCFRRTAEESA